MTRISTAGAQQAALADIMRAQQELNIAQRQLSTGKRANDLKGFGAQAETLAATRAVLAREASYAETGKRLQARLDAQAAAIGEVSDAASGLRQALTEALGLSDGSTLLSRMEHLFAQTSAALNMKFGDEYVFGGGRDHAPPFEGASLADLSGPAPAADLFRNGDLRGIVRLDDGRPMQTGVLADELGRDLMEALKRIQDFADANGGAFSDPLTEAERTFLTTEIANVSAAFQSIALVEANNGLAQNTVESATIRASQRHDALEGMVGDMEDADMAGVILRVEQAQVALHASAKVFTVLTGTTLLNYL